MTPQPLTEYITTNSPLATYLINNGYGVPEQSTRDGNTVWIFTIPEDKRYIATAEINKFFARR